MNDSPAEFREFIELVNSGNRSAAEQFFAKYRRVLRLLAVGMLHRKVLVRVDESDVAQEAMRKAVTDLQQFDGRTEAQFVNWLKTILQRTAQNFVREHRAEKRDVGRTVSESCSSAILLAEKCIAPSSDCPQHRASEGELLVQLAWGLGELSDNERSVIEMQHLQGMRVDDIASALDKTPVAVTGLIYRAMKKLKKLMAQKGSGPGAPE